MSLDYTLEPLRESGVDALSTAGVEGLKMVILKEIEYAFNTPNAEVINHRGRESVLHLPPASPGAESDSCRSKALARDL